MSNIYTNPEKYGLTILKRSTPPCPTSSISSCCSVTPRAVEEDGRATQDAHARHRSSTRGSRASLETMTDYENLQHELDTMRGADPTDKVSMLRLAAEAVRKIKLGRHGVSDGHQADMG
jgi:hypothetical protein